MKDSVKEILEEALFDENRVVTYKWLSRNMELSVQEAKNDLEDYFEAYKNEKGLHAVYYLCGEEDRKDYKVTKVCLVRDVDLEKAKRRYSPLNGCHVYSVQCANLKDFGPIYNVDLDDDQTKIGEDISRLQITPNSSASAGVSVTSGVPTTSTSREEVGKSKKVPAETSGKPSVSIPDEPRRSPRKNPEPEFNTEVERKKVEKTRGKQRSKNAISTIFSTMGQKAEGKKKEPETKGNEVEAVGVQEEKSKKEAEEVEVTKKEGEKKNAAAKGKEKLKKPPPKKTEHKKTRSTAEKKPVVEEKPKPPVRKNKRHIDSSSDEAESQTVTSSASITQKSTDDIFATEVSSPEPSPAKHSPRRSPRKFSQSQSQTQKLFSQSPSRERKSDSAKQRKRGKQQELEPESSEGSESDQEILPPTPSTVVRKVKATETFVDDEGFMVVKTTSKTVTSESGGSVPKEKGSPKRKKSPPKAKMSPAKKKTKKEPPKQKQATLSNFFTKK